MHEALQKLIYQDDCRAEAVVIWLSVYRRSARVDLNPYCENAGAPDRRGVGADDLHYAAVPLT